MYEGKRLGGGGGMGESIVFIKYKLWILDITGGVW